MQALLSNSLTPKGHRRHRFARPSDVHPDLTEEMFREVLEYARDSTTVSDNGFLAPTGPGTFMYHYGISKIRELLAEKGWKSDSFRNLPYTVSQDESVKITLATGNATTGIKEGLGPQLKEKGRTPSFLNGQMTLFNPDDYAVDQPQGTLWYLVFHVDRKLQEIRMELSMPVFDNTNQVKGWVHRIIMDPVPLQNTRTTLPFNEEVPLIDISPVSSGNADIAVGY